MSWHVDFCQTLFCDARLAADTPLGPVCGGGRDAVSCVIAMMPENKQEQASIAALERALAFAPGYSSWRKFDPGRQVSAAQRFSALPILTKHDLREQFPNGFVPSDHDLAAGLQRGDVIYAQTSGSTEDKVTIVFNVPWWEASERAAWQLNNHAKAIATGTHREAVLASPRCVGPGFSEQPLDVKTRTLGRHLFLNQKINPASWTDADVRQMAGELNDFRPAVLEGDPAYLAAFARRAAHVGLEIYQPPIISLTYSYPSRIYLRSIRRLFASPIASSYGTTETGHVFFECEAGRLHENAEHCRVDFKPWSPRFGGPELGSLYVTVLHNPWFSVLRFDVGDVARIAKTPCSCGRTAGITLERIEGRRSDVTFTTDGRTVTVDELDRALIALDDLHAWQIEQADARSYRLSVICDSPKTASDAADILRRIYGDNADVRAEAVAALKHEASGKFRFAHVQFSVAPSFFFT